MFFRDPPRKTLADHLESWLPAAMAAGGIIWALAGLAADVDALSIRVTDMNTAVTKVADDFREYETSEMRYTSADAGRDRDEINRRLDLLEGRVNLIAVSVASTPQRDQDHDR